MASRRQTHKHTIGARPASGRRAIFRIIVGHRRNLAFLTLPRQQSDEPMPIPQNRLRRPNMFFEIGPQHSGRRFARQWPRIGQILDIGEPNGRTCLRRMDPPDRHAMADGIFDDFPRAAAVLPRPAVPYRDEKIAVARDELADGLVSAILIVTAPVERQPGATGFLEQALEFLQILGGAAPRRRDFERG